jgi:hypothetical protein
MDSTKLRNKHTSQQKGNQRLLYESIQSFNHLRLNSFILLHPGEIIQTKNVPQERERLEAPRVLLDRTEQSRI